MSRALIFVDTETTGLDPEKDRLIELSWARETGPVKTLYFGVQEVPKIVDDLIGFTERDLGSQPASEDWKFDEFLTASEGNTMVAANPMFDASFLQNNSLFRFHYRMLDIESYAMGKLGLNEMPGLSTIRETLIGRGFKITQNKHTSSSDVECTRECYNILKYL